MTPPTGHIFIKKVKNTQALTIKKKKEKKSVHPLAVGGDPSGEEVFVGDSALWWVLRSKKTTINHLAIDNQ